MESHTTESHFRRRGLSRFDKIVMQRGCNRRDILQLEYLGSRNRKSNDFFSPDDLLRFDYLKDKPWTRVAPRIMQSVALAEARESIDAGESEWLLIAVNSILRYIPQWLSEAPGRRRIWLKRTAEALRAVAEGSRYIMTFPKRADVATRHVNVRPQPYSNSRTITQPPGSLSRAMPKR